MHFDTLNTKREKIFVKNNWPRPLLYFLDAGDRALSKRARGGWKGTFDGEEAEEEEQEEKEEGFSSFFLSFSFSRLFQEIFITFFRCRSIIFVRRNEGKFFEIPLLIR